MTNRLQFGSKTIPAWLVYQTWTKAILDEDACKPEDWVYRKKGVLVGITPSPKREGIGVESHTAR